MSTGIGPLNSIPQSSTSFEGYLLSNPSYQFLVPINPDFYRNLDNLRDLVADTSELQSLIANVFVTPFDPFGSSGNEEEEENTENQYRRFYSAVHRRYILTDEGMSTIISRQVNGLYGVCPCYRCSSAHLFPAALRSEYGVGNVKLFCPSCKEVYNAPYPFDYIDGAFFGSDFIPELSKHHPEVMVNPGPKYEPKIFGFKIHRSRLPIKSRLIL